MAKLCKRITFLIFESNTFEEFSNAGKKWTRKGLVHVDIKINGTFYYRKPSDSLY